MPESSAHGRPPRGGGLCDVLLLVSVGWSYACRFFMAGVARKPMMQHTRMYALML